MWCPALRRADHTRAVSLDRVQKMTQGERDLVSLLIVLSEVVEDGLFFGEGLLRVLDLV